MSKIEAILDQAVFLLHSGDVQPEPHQLAWQLDAKVLRNHIETGVVLEVSTPASWSAQETISFDCPVEFIMLGGELAFADLSLYKGDFLRIPSGSPIAPPVSKTGGQFLLFFDHGSPISKVETGDVLPNSAEWLQVKGEDSPWVPGTALAEAGIDNVPLKIKHYKQDPDTGARTYLVAVSPGIVIPWEVHEIAEEAYIIEGDYRLAECLPSGSKVGNYTQGGYFYRPAGIAHNGPESGTKTGVVMLIRTPGPLTVKLVDGCKFDVS